MILSKRETTPDSYVYVAWVATCIAIFGVNLSKTRLKRRGCQSQQKTLTFCDDKQSK